MKASPSPLAKKARRLLASLALLGASVLATSLPCQAGNLATVRTGALPAIPLSAATGPLSAMAVVDGRPLAIARAQSWLLDADEKAWLPQAWRPDADVLGVAGNGKTAFLLLGAAPGTQSGTPPLTANPVLRVTSLSWAAGEPTLHTLPALPKPITAARGALLADTLFITGVDACGAGRPSKAGWPDPRCPARCCRVQRAPPARRMCSTWCCSPGRPRLRPC